MALTMQEMCDEMPKKERSVINDVEHCQKVGDELGEEVLAVCCVYPETGLSGINAVSGGTLYVTPYRLFIDGREGATVVKIEDVAGINFSGGNKVFLSGRKAYKLHMTLRNGNSLTWWLGSDIEWGITCGDIIAKVHRASVLRNN